MPLASHPPQLLPRHPSAARRPTAPRRGGYSALILLLLAACSGPKGATPIPEPPSLDPSRVGVGVGVLINSRVTLEGEPGAASPGATIRATNLESTAEPTDAEVNGDGSFALSLELPIGAEVRLQPARTGTRGTPYDWLRAEEGLVPPPRHGCLQLTPGIVFSADGVLSSALDNSCSSEVRVTQARARLGLEDFTVSAAEPFTVPPGESRALEISFERQEPGAREDVLFFDVVVDVVERRYPVSVFAPER